MFLIQALERARAPSPAAPAPSFSTAQAPSPSRAPPAKKLQPIPRPPPVPTMHRERMGRTALQRRVSSSSSAVEARRRHATEVASALRRHRGDASATQSPRLPAAVPSVISQSQDLVPDAVETDLLADDSASNVAAEKRRPKRSTRSQDPTYVAPKPDELPLRKRRSRHPRVNSKKIIESLQKEWQARLDVLPPSFRGTGPSPPLNALQVNALRLEQDIAVRFSSRFVLFLFGSDPSF